MTSHTLRDAIHSENEQDKDAMQQALEALEMALKGHAWLSDEYKQLWDAKIALKERVS